MRRGRSQRAIHPRDWPQSDRDRLDLALGKVGRMHKMGPANGWSRATTRTVLSAYSLGLGWLRDEGLLDWSLSPAARWPEPVLERYDDHLCQTYSKGTHRNRLSGLDRGISVIEPTADRSLFLRALKRLGKVHPSADKERRVQSTLDLEDLGDELMYLGDAGSHRSPRLASALYRTGLQIGILADMLNRIGEFTLLQEGAHVYLADGQWYLAAAKPNSATKRMPRRRPIPQRLAHRLERYITFHRDILCRDRTGVVHYKGKALWVSIRCRPQSENSIRENICKFTMERFGEPVNPHAFRYSAVTTIAIHAPEQMHAVQVTAGHTPGSRTTEENYNKAGSYSASQQWNAIAEAIRERGLERRRLRGRRRA